MREDVAGVGTRVAAANRETNQMPHVCRCRYISRCRAPEAPTSRAPCNDPSITHSSFGACSYWTEHTYTCMLTAAWMPQYGRYVHPLHGGEAFSTWDTSTGLSASGEAARPLGLDVHPYTYFIRAAGPLRCVRACVRVYEYVCANGGPSNKIWSI